MRIAIHAADLDHSRIDGTRVYLLNMLKNFGRIDEKDSFFIYHQKNFNPNLTPPSFPNYFFKNFSFPILWTQTRFAWEIFKDRPDVLWMPVHNMPLIRRKNLKTVITVHDLAFKIFPQYFTKKDLAKLNKLSDMAIRNSDHIIAVSECTKKDILKFYPEIRAEKISVIYHGFDAGIFKQKMSDEDVEELSKSYKLKTKNYLLYVGAIQPRKNLEVLIEAFEKIKSDPISPQDELKLVIAGAPAWKYNGIIEKINKNKFSKDIIITGNLGFEKIAELYRNAKIFIFPSLYEGFGIPVLEAMASETPVICAENSSLIEAGGKAALYFKTGDSQDLADCITRVMEDSGLEKALIRQGIEHVKSFSWEKCTRETLAILLKVVD
jgi:glycosyltransferase involved in cell wall biosynthesis